MYRAKTDHFFTFLGEKIVRFPKRFVLAILSITLLLASGAATLRLDVTTAALFKNDDPTTKNYQAFQQQFGRDGAILLGFFADDPFAERFLKKLDALQEDMEENLPFLERTTSLISATAIRRQGDMLNIGPVLKDIPSDPEELEAIKALISNTRIYQGALINRTGDFTIMVLRPAYLDAGTATGEEEWDTGIISAETTDPDTNLLKKLWQRIRPPREQTDLTHTPLTPMQLDRFSKKAIEIVTKHETADFPIIISGGLAIDEAHGRSIRKDMGSQLGMVYGMIFLLLFLLFRRWTGVLLPLLVVGLALASAIGLMGFFGFPVTLVTQILPPLILAVAVGDSVHFLFTFFKLFNKNGDVEQAVITTLTRTGLAIVFTSLTTAGALLSFLSSSIAPIGHIGLIAAMGILAAMLYTLLLLPAILCLIPPKQAKAAIESKLKNNWAPLFGEIGFKHPKAILVLAAVLAGFGLSGIGQIKFSQDVLEWFPDGTPIKTATKQINKSLGSAVSLEIVIDTNKSNGLYDPEILQKLDLLGHELEGLRVGPAKISKTYSIVDNIKWLHQALANDKSPLPQNPDLIAQEFLLFENGGSDDRKEVVDDDFSKARFTLRVPWMDAVELLPLRNEIQKRFETAFAGKADVTLTGALNLMSQSVVGVIQSLANSYLFSAVLISLMMMIVLKSLKLGLISMIPNFLPLLITLGLMGWADIPIDMFTVLFGGIALGLVVDDTVHFFTRFQHFCNQGYAPEQAVAQSLEEVGGALMLTSLTMCGGFLVFLTGSMTTLFNFGWLMSLTLAMALITDFLVGPALIALLYQKRASDLAPSLLGKPDLVQD